MRKRSVAGLILMVGIVLAFVVVDPFQWFDGNDPTPQVVTMDFSGKTNFLPNGGFETAGGGDSHPDKWYVEEGNGAYEFLRDATASHSGTNCIHLANCWNADGWEDRVMVESYLSPLPGGTNRSFLLHGWARSKGCAPGQLQVRFKGYDTAENLLFQDTYYLLNTTEWETFDFVIEQVPDTATQFRASVRLDNSPGDAYYDDLFLYLLTDTEYANVSRLDKYNAPAFRGNQPTGTTTGQTHLEEIDGVWWLVDPDGTPFWCTGPTGFGTTAAENPTLWTNLGQPDAEGLETYRDASKVRGKTDLAFNTGVKSTTDGNTENYIMWLNFATEANGVPAWVLRDKDGNPFGEAGAHLFPDPFDPTWQTYATNVASEIPTWFVERPDAIGYWTDNEMSYGALYKYFWSDGCAVAFVDWLQGTGDWTGFEKPPQGAYQTIAELNSAWSASGWTTYAYGSFDEIATGATKPTIHHFNDTRVMEDLYAFERVVYQKYVNTVIAAIRAREQALGSTQKLIISDRIAYDGPGFFSDALKRVMDIFSAYDIVAINAYPMYNRDRTWYSREYMEDLEYTFHGLTGRPVLVGEFGVAAVDAGMEVARWRTQTVDTQAQRGVAYRNLVTTLFQCPWTVGMFWFSWANKYTSGGVADPRNCGLVDDANEFYGELATQVQATNTQVNTRGRSGAFTLADIAWDHYQFRILDGTL